MKIFDLLGKFTLLPFRDIGVASCLYFREKTIPTAQLQLKITKMWVKNLFTQTCFFTQILFFWQNF